MLEIQTAMLLCAGFGKRMGELTAAKPKPTIEIMGRSFIHRIFDLLLKHKIFHVVINIHYMSDILIEHVKSYDKIEQLTVDFLYEKEILETAGGVINALDFIRGEEFFIINGDVLFCNKTVSPFTMLANNYDKNLMDLMILLQPLEESFGYYGHGDFNISPLKQDAIVGQLIAEPGKKPYVHAGVYLANKSVFKSFTKEPRKMMDIFEMRKKSDFHIDRFYGAVYDGTWFHIGDKKSYYALDDYLKEKNISI